MSESFGRFTLMTDIFGKVFLTTEGTGNTEVLSAWGVIFLTELFQNYFLILYFLCVFRGGFLEVWSFN